MSKVYKVCDDQHVYVAEHMFWEAYKYARSKACQLGPGHVLTVTENARPRCFVTHNDVWTSEWSALRIGAHGTARARS